MFIFVVISEYLRNDISYSAQITLRMVAPKECYIDGTLKSVVAPFFQPRSIQQWESIKQVIVIFALMSSASIDGYKAVLEHMFNDIQVPHLSSFITDFECAASSAFHTVLTQAKRKGCHFHWTQAI